MGEPNLNIDTYLTKYKIKREYHTNITNFIELKVPFSKIYLPRLTVH